MVAAVLLSQPALRVLFVGDSFTYFNDLPRLVALVSEGRLKTDRITASGWNLDRHWRAGRALARIRAGGWNVVVLQEEGALPVSDPARFQADVRRFALAAHAAGARPVLLLTWAKRDKPPAQALLTNAFRRVGRSLGVPVMPVGEAWRLWRARPNAPGLYVADGIHPDFRGSYLSALVIVGALRGRPLTTAPTDFGSTLGVAHVAARIDPAELPALLRCAREALERGRPVR